MAIPNQDIIDFSASPQEAHKRQPDDGSSLRLDVRLLFGERPWHECCRAKDPAYALTKRPVL